MAGRHVIFLWSVALLLITSRGGVAGEPLSRYVRTDSPEAQIEVLASERAAFTIPRTVYGTFLENISSSVEDIGDSIFGGVSAQLLDNPSLETYYASLEFLERRFSAPAFRRSTRIGLPLPWLPLRWEDGWRFEPRWGEAANSFGYLFLIGIADRDVGIRQTIYLPVDRERSYQGSLFAFSAKGPVEIQMSFRRKDDPTITIAETRVEVPSGEEWQKYDFQLTVPPNSVLPLQPVDFVVAIRGEHRVSLDHIRLYPADAVDGLLDPDIIRAAKALNSPLLRIGGNFTSGYHWRDGVGPLDRRPTRLNQAWGYPEHNEFGTDEFMTFCRLIGSLPSLSLNLGSGTAQEARSWVEYVQGGPESTEGRRRAANGHPEPYQMAAWEMGNELWGKFQIGWHNPESHARRYRQFYRAIRDLVPAQTMIIATGGDVDFFEPWNAPLLNKYPDELQYLSTHFVGGMDEMLNPVADRDFIWAAGLAVPLGVERALAPMREQIDSNPATRGRVKLAFTEWLFWSPEDADVPNFRNLGGALVAAGWMNMLLRNADFIPVAYMTGLVDFGGIHKKRSRVFVAPQYWAFSLYSNHAGDTPVATHTRVRHYDIHLGQRRVPEIPDVPYLDVLATIDSRNGKLTLFVVSRDWKSPMDATIRLKDFSAASEASVYTLTADSLLVRNDEERPEAVRPVTTTVNVSGESFHYTFPARSLTVLSFKPR